MNSIDEEELDLIDPDPFIVPREQRNSSMPRKISTSNTTKLMRGSGLFKYYNAKDPLSSLNTSEMYLLIRFYILEEIQKARRLNLKEFQ